MSQETEQPVGPTLTQITVGELRIDDVGARVLVPYEGMVLDATLTRVRGYLSSFQPNIVVALELRGSSAVKIEIDPTPLDFLIQIEREASDG